MLQIPVQKASSSVIETRYVPGVHFNSGFYFFLLAYTKLTNTLHRDGNDLSANLGETPTTRPLCSGEHRSRLSPGLKLQASQGTCPALL